MRKVLSKRRNTLSASLFKVEGQKILIFKTGSFSVCALSNRYTKRGKDLVTGMKKT